MSFLPDYDDAIGRVRFAGVGRPKYRKRVRCEDRYEDRRYRKGTARFHAKTILVCSIRFYDTSGGFSDATEERIATPSSEIDCDLYYPEKLGLRPRKDWQSAAGRSESNV
jgi:hypothetical protein